MIPPGGTFDYNVIVERGPDTEHRWFGRARTLRDSSIHPGMLGSRPEFVLENGRVSLISTESKLTLLTNKHFREWGPPPASRKFVVGAAPAAVLQPGDQFAFHRFGTGDLALTIIRNDLLVLGTGALVELPLGKGIEVEDDVRVEELDLYELAANFQRVADLESLVFWIDLGQGNLDAQLRVMHRLPRSGQRVVAIARARNDEGDTVDPDLYDKLLDCDTADYTRYFEVDARFADKQAWVNYVKALPKGRPSDLHLSLRIGSEHIKLCEGEEAFIGEYYARVERVFAMYSAPGDFSLLAIARMSPGLTKEMVIESASLLAKQR